MHLLLAVLPAEPGDEVPGEKNDVALSLTQRRQLDVDHDEIDGAIASQDPDGEKPRLGRSRVIPLARVTGTLESPRVEITDEAVLRFAALYATERHREKWEREIDERLGEGAGSQVIDVLDGILRGEPREPRR